jgi:uncharacterized UPF0160 family protein
MEQEFLIGTHDGIHHPDDVWAAAIISERFIKKEPLTDEKALRTRDKDLLAKCTYVIDVGGECDPQRGRFDHHQHDFAVTYEEDGQPYASAGLTWEAFGHAIILDAIEDNQTLSSTTRAPNDELALDIFDRISRNVIKGIDAEDVNWPLEWPTGGTSLSDAIRSFIPAAMPELSHGEDAYNKAFLEAVAMVRPVLRNMIIRTGASIVSYSYVQMRYQAALHSSNPFFKLNNFVPWHGAVVDAEKDLHEDKKLKYIVYGRTDGSWAAQSLPMEPFGRTSRAPFPEAWRGLADGALQKVSGIPSAKFCHKSGFLFVAASSRDVQAAARISADKIYGAEVVGG